MQCRPYGKTGIRVSILGYGAMRLPTLPDNTVDLEKSVPLLRRALDNGVNYIDTAHSYINGTSEVAVGQAIKGYDRSKVYIATKIGVIEEEEAHPDVWQKKLDLSLRRLDTPYIDFLLCHALNWNAYTHHLTRPGWPLDIARKAKEQGLVKHICFSSHDDPQNIIRLIDTGEFASILLQYNYLDLHNAPAIAHAAEKGLGVTVMGPLAGGRLVTPKGMVVDSEGMLELKTPELALRYVWNNPNVSVAISGMDTMQQVDENIAAANRVEKMSEREQAQVQQFFETNQKMADLYCTGCADCMPCPNNVNIPENFRYMNWFKVWGLEEQAIEAYGKLSAEGTWTTYSNLVQGLQARECNECGECEPKCPQNIRIMDQLKETDRTLRKR
jgi:uncharacterized protein